VSHGARLNLLLALTILGFLVPNAFVIAYLADEGFAIGDYFAAWFDSLPAAQITIDAVMAALAFLVWTTWDGPRSGVRGWWIAIPATLLVGICFGLPLYLFLRERALGQDQGATEEYVEAVR
jgi:hypothetical protein